MAGLQGGSDAGRYSAWRLLRRDAPTGHSGGNRETGRGTCLLYRSATTRAPFQRFSRGTKPGVRGLGPSAHGELRRRAPMIAACHSLYS